MSPARGGTVMMATGGSGGHIYPAVATAEHLLALGYDLVFVGQASGMEAQIVPEAGFAFEGVRAGKWHRGNPDPRQALKAFQGLLDAQRLVRRHAPRAVLGFGGFASFPALAAARLTGTPIVLHEGNSYPGRVVRWFAPHAQVVAATAGETRQHLPNVKRFEVTGFPIREARAARHEARTRLGLPQDALVTLVMGGSQGSVFLNTHVPKAFAQLSAHRAQPHVVLHSAGRNWLDDLRQNMSSYTGYVVAPYVDAVLAWSAADLAVTRAGIGTLAEAAFHGVPVIAVPLPSSAENHQLHNARALVASGAGRLVEEHQVESLTRVWAEMLDDGVRLNAAQAARARSPQGAAAALAHLVHGAIQGKTKTPSAHQHLPDARAGETR
jgi:UDP-N-acetylglucosamine--N-acetylmuramyl-(pentapeptide) pyrophosphoryl-undecaprenol N-acetylglucosamine transferase